MADPQLPSLPELTALVEAREQSTDEPPQSTRLRAAIEIGHELGAIGDALIEHFVREARAAELSWTQIGQQFGTSKQAAQKRYGAEAVEEGSWPGRWAPSARDALTRASEDARELRHTYVGTEHMLLGLVATDGGVAAQVLADLGVTREAVLETSCMNPGPGDRPWDDCLGVQPRLKQALEHAGRIADGLGHPVPDTEHLLAGIVTVPGALAVEILKRLGVSAGAVRSALAQRLDIEPDRLVVTRRRRRRLLAKAS
jgi:hypothetical protein